LATYSQRGLEIMQFEKVKMKIKEMYPDIKNEEIEKLINEALQEDSVQNVIVKYICYVKERIEKKK